MSEKKIQGFNRSSIFDIKPMDVTIICRCKNCKASWTVETKAYAVTNDYTYYDYCSECNGEKQYETDDH